MRSRSDLVLAGGAEVLSFRRVYNAAFVTKLLEPEILRVQCEFFLANLRLTARIRRIFCLPNAQHGAQAGEAEAGSAGEQPAKE